MDRFRRTVALTVGALVLGCSPEQIEWQTDELEAVMVMHSDDGENTTAVARFYGPEDLLFRLNGLDRVTASIPGWVVLLDASYATDPVYRASVPAVGVDERNLIIVQREARTNAAGSEVSMPPPTEPLVEVESFSRQAGVEVSWVAVEDSDTLTLIVEGDCVEEAEFDLDPSAGLWQLPGGEVEGSGSCEVSLALRRTRAGVVDPGFRGGSFEGRQERAVLVQSTP